MLVHKGDSSSVKRFKDCTTLAHVTMASVLRPEDDGIDRLVAKLNV